MRLGLLNAGRDRIPGRPACVGLLVVPWLQLLRPLCCSAQIYLHNHLSFILYYHREDLEEDREHTYRVVRFEVIPQSVRLEGEWVGVARGQGWAGLGSHTQGLCALDSRRG